MGKLELSWKWRKRRNMKIRVEVPKNQHVIFMAFRMDYDALCNFYSISLRNGYRTMIYNSDMDSKPSASALMEVYKEMWNDGLLAAGWFEHSPHEREELTLIIIERLKEINHELIRKETVEGTPIGFNVHFHGDKIVGYEKVYL